MAVWNKIGGRCNTIYWRNYYNDDVNDDEKDEENLTVVVRVQYASLEMCKTRTSNGATFFSFMS